jgi:hypothetical protein
MTMTSATDTWGPCVISQEAADHHHHTQTQRRCTARKIKPRPDDANITEEDPPPQLLLHTLHYDEAALCRPGPRPRSTETPRQWLPTQVKSPLERALIAPDRARAPPPRPFGFPQGVT